MTPASKPRYRQLRNRWGLCIALGWIFLWYLRFEYQEAAALASLQDCNALSGAQSLKCSVSQGAQGVAGAAGYVIKMFLVLLSSPLAFLVSGHLARARIERDEAAQMAGQARSDAVRARDEAEAQATRSAQIETAAQATRRAIDRSEFIQKVGSVNDLLALLPTEAQPNRIAIIQQGIAKELRDLVAKHTLPDLADLVHSDETVALLLTKLLDDVSKTQLSSSDAIDVLKAAQQRLPARPR